MSELRKQLVNHFVEINQHSWRRSRDGAMEALGVSRSVAIDRLLVSLKDRVVHEVFSFNGHFVAAYSTGSHVGLHFSESKSDVECTECVGQLSVMRVFVQQEHIHLFVADAQHMIHHFYLCERGLLRSITAKLNEDICDVVPVTVHLSHQLPEYFWSVTPKGVVFHRVSIGKEVLSLLKYDVPTSSKTFIDVQSFKDERSGSQGLVVNYYDNLKGELLSLVLDTVAAILTVEKGGVQNGHTPKLLSTPLSCTVKKQQSASDGNSWFKWMGQQQQPETQEFTEIPVPVCTWIHDVQHDHCSNYATDSFRSTNCHFSWKMTVVSASALSKEHFIYSIQFSTKQSILRRELKRCGVNLLCGDAQSGDLSCAKIDFHDTHTVVTHPPGSDERLHPSTTRSLIPNKDSECMSLWLACSTSRLCLSFRLPQLQALLYDHGVHLQDDFLRRMVLIEAMLALGLSEVIATAIEKKNASTMLGEEFVLRDVQRLFEWLIGSQHVDVVSVFQDTVQLSTTLTRKQIVPVLRQRTYSDKAIRAAHGLMREQDEFLLASQGLDTIARALANRKLFIVHRSSKTRKDVLLEPLGGDLLSQSLVELYLVHQDIQVLSQVMGLISFLLREPLVTFESFSCSTDGDTLWIESSRSVRRVVCEHMKGVLPVYLSSTRLLFDDLVDAIPSTNQEWQRSGVHCDEWNPRGGCDVDERLTMLLYLPFTLAQWRSSTIVSGTAHFAGHNLRELGSTVQHDVTAAKRVLQYLICESAVTSASLIAADGLFQEDLCRSLSLILQCHLEEVEWIHSLQLIDAGVQLESAVLKLCYSTGIAFLDEQGWLLPVLRKLLSQGNVHNASELVRALTMRDHGLLVTMEGAVAVAIAQPYSVQNELSDEWRGHWLAAKQRLGSIANIAQARQAALDITFAMAVWTMRHNRFHEFLASKFDYLEVEAIIAILQDQASDELKKAIPVCPAVDTLFAFFLKHYRVSEAEKLHQLHKSVVMTTPHSMEPEVLSALADREALLTAFKYVELPPAVDQGLQQNVPLLRSLLK